MFKVFLCVVRLLRMIPICLCLFKELVYVCLQFLCMLTFVSCVTCLSVSDILVFLRFCVEGIVFIGFVLFFWLILHGF